MVTILQMNKDAVVDRVLYEAWEVESRIPGKNGDSAKFKAKYFQVSTINLN